MAAAFDDPGFDAAWAVGDLERCDLIEHCSTEQRLVAVRAGGTKHPGGQHGLARPGLYDEFGVSSTALFRHVCYIEISRLSGKGNDHEKCGVLLAAGLGRPGCLCRGGW